MPPGNHTLEIATLIVLAGLLLGWLCATALRRQDHRTFVLSRAPKLPIRTLHAHDDAWIRGIVVSDSPLRCPWFGDACVAYAYSIEEKRTRTYTDSKGKRRTTTNWVTVHSETQTIDCILDDGQQIALNLRSAENEALQRIGSDYETTRRRHSAEALPVGAVVSALGVLRDDRTFGPMREVPLLVTAETSRARIARAASKETLWLFLALTLPYAGVVGATAVFRQAEVWQDWIVPAALGLLALVPQWALLTYNRLVRLKHQVLAAEKQVSIEMQMRSDLVPNLVTVVRAASDHERQLLRSLAEMRTPRSLAEQIAGEDAARQATRAVMLLHEQYPKLRSDALYRDLHDKLWAIEEKLAHARSFYNDTIQEWNDRVAKVPAVLVASACGFRPRPHFTVDEGEALPPPLGHTPGPPSPDPLES
jgi:LemA protein